MKKFGLWNLCLQVNDIGVGGIKSFNLPLVCNFIIDIEYQFNNSTTSDRTI